MLVENMGSGFAGAILALMVISVSLAAMAWVSLLFRNERAFEIATVAAVAAASVMFGLFVASIGEADEAKSKEIERVYDVSVVSMDREVFTAISDGRAIDCVLDCDDVKCTAYEAGGSELPKR